MNLTPFTAKQFDDGAADKSDGKTIGDAEGEGHHNNSKKSRDSLIRSRPVYVGNVMHHQATHNNQGRRGDRMEHYSAAFNQITSSQHAGERGKEEGQEEQQCGDDIGKARSSPPLQHRQHFRYSW